MPPLAAGEEAIVVLQRGPTPDDPSAPETACFPGEKAENGDRRRLRRRPARQPPCRRAPGVYCGSGGFPASPPIVAPCTTHEAFHHIFDKAPSLSIPYVPADEPAIGDLGEKVSVEASFDGWGFAHLYDAQTSEEIDAFAIPESLDPANACGFGDLSIHEFATDPDENLAYASYYSGGIRVFMFGRDFGLAPTGA